MTTPCPTCHGSGHIDIDPSLLLEFPCRGGRKWKLDAARLASYHQTYPDLDIGSEVRKARQWLIDNRTKRKTVRGMPHYLANWLSRAEPTMRKEAAAKREKQIVDGRIELDRQRRTREEKQIATPQQRRAALDLFKRNLRQRNGGTNPCHRCGGHTPAGNVTHDGRAWCGCPPAKEAGAA